MVDDYLVCSLVDKDKEGAEPRFVVGTSVRNLGEEDVAVLSVTDDTRVDARDID
mgnify:CR=1 FL=1